jgi:hypothetical protein
MCRDDWRGAFDRAPEPRVPNVFLMCSSCAETIGAAHLIALLNPVIAASEKGSCLPQSLPAIQVQRKKKEKER